MGITTVCLAAMAHQNSICIAGREMGEKKRCRKKRGPDHSLVKVCQRRNGGAAVLALSSAKLLNIARVTEYRTLPLPR